MTMTVPFFDLKFIGNALGLNGSKEFVQTNKTKALLSPLNVFKGKLAEKRTKIQRE